MPSAVITLAHPFDFAGWRAATRDLAGRHVPPDAITWQVAAPGETPPAPVPGENCQPFSIPREMMQMAADVLQSMLPDRFALAYGLIYAHVTGTPPDATALERINEAADTVRTETRHLRQNLFTLMKHEGEDAGWSGTLDSGTYAPESNARFITYQLSLAPWRLVLPEREICWNGTNLLHGPHGAPAPLSFGCLPPPALPLVTDLDIERITSLRAVALAAKTCLICPMARQATQTVFGEGQPGARMMFVGEQPGDREDLAGRPFVGPAGQLFDRALEEAEIRREDTYVTNTVKHFKFQRRGTRRIHEKAGRDEIRACAPWLAAERRILRPQVLVMW
ncbi:uracil-DNA glycosylase family protein, partial [Komagataeibacter kakiaceti]|uniref:uracil-DNA glycosylase family protein n=1 Tax=Komagataeibacter kakiaceti TaxID=943261 RepID=UPI0004719E5E